jgi:DNA-binding transcriptional ArsR family regulator
MTGDADIAAVADVLADRSRSRMLLALCDGRALPASRLADEAGIAASTCSGHLSRLVAAGMLVVEPYGRHRYYRLAGPHVASLLESIARLAPPMTVRSLQDGTQAAALRRARTCYDHLAGRFGVAVMDALLGSGVLESSGVLENSVLENSVLENSGVPDAGAGGLQPRRSGRDRPCAPGWDVSYVLTDSGHARLKDIGIDCSAAGRRPFVRYCVDWSEQRHHLAGALGSHVLSRLDDLRWIKRRPGSRAVDVTDAGARGLRRAIGLEVADLVTGG